MGYSIENDKACEVVGMIGMGLLALLAICAAVGVYTILKYAFYLVF